MIAQTPTETTATANIIYPDRDGLPMSDNTKQFRWIVTIKENLELIYAQNPDVFVAGDLLWYPVEGNNTIRQAPDIMVALGRPKGDRGSYQQWREDGIAPQVVFEILSPGNRMGAMNRKLRFYEQYGVNEYYIYDPDRVDFTGWVRNGDRLESISQGEGDITEQPIDWISPLLGVRFQLESSEELKIYRPDGQPFLSFIDLDLRRQDAEQRADTAQQRADTAQQRADTAEQRADTAEQRADAIQQQAEKLAAKLRELGIDPTNL
jgi:Uma2 family endonuclease